MYGLPKIHKPGTPLRPFVSCMSSFTFNLSKYLTGILSPQTGNTPNTMPNTTAFAEFLRGQHIDSHEALISFGIESLFNQLPIGDACCVALRRLEEDPELPDQTSLSPTKIIFLLEFVLCSMYFLYGGTYYEQTDGAAMGSLVSAVIANLYMEAFEEEALQSCPPDCRPTVRKRYIDDTFVIAPWDQASHVLNHLNSLKPGIQFTIEVEQDSSMAFLDTMVHREPDGSLTSTVYRKPTHTNQYLAFDSHHPESQSSRSKTSNEAERPEYKAFTVLPFVDGISRWLKRILEDHGVRTVFRLSTTLRSQLVRPKDPVPPGRHGGVVYRIPCGDCDKVYVGETGRPVGKRIKEHQCDMRLSCVDSSAVAKHTWGVGHHHNWDGVQCVDHDQHWYTRHIKEAIHIRLNQHSINRDSGINIPWFWLPSIRQNNHRSTTEPRGHTPSCPWSGACNAR
ncbi:uncharacterized protein LOC110986762 [Acanthaster planci]|uniref:Uncharacterized protein LOC110986762 n=1 Tax=Acanthaster planci TaxID=133434 RepID=A0A8B7ZIC8_ACAPL|nr:uncharacterized protein LOC110986762 [Acanthaster planci]